MFHFGGWVKDRTTFPDPVPHLPNHVPFPCHPCHWTSFVRSIRFSRLRRFMPIGLCFGHPFLSLKLLRGNWSESGIIMDHCKCFQLWGPVGWNLEPVSAAVPRARTNLEVLPEKSLRQDAEDWRVLARCHVALHGWSSVCFSKMVKIRIQDPLWILKQTKIWLNRWGSAFKRARPKLIQNTFSTCGSFMYASYGVYTLCFRICFENYGKLRQYSQ